MQNKTTKIIIASCILLLTIMVMTLKQYDKNLTVALVMPPTSTDPLDYDYSIHHNTMRSVFSSLVTMYKAGALAPQVAKKWSVSEDKKIWTFEIDEQWTFENGDKVTPEIVLKNFKRVLILKNRTNSKSGLLEFLVDADKLNSFDADIKGLTIDKNSVVFTFVKPVTDVLEKISFGLYGIAHPSDYTENAEWINKKKAIASGFYKIVEWDKDKFVLELRKNVHPERISEKSIKKVKFIFPEDMGKIGDAALVFSDRLSNSLNESEWSFASTTLDNKIIYIQVMNWDDKTSVYSDKTFRQNLRNIFYKNLEKAGMKPRTSFFPLSINGVKEFSVEMTSQINSKVEAIRTQPFFVTKYKEEKKKKSQGDIFAEAFYGLCSEVNAKPQINNYPENSSDEKRVFDIQYLGTGISIFSPREDIRFAFLSKQGIMLPDESGKILKVLNEDFDIQSINEELWDQAIIWPIKHYSSGFWYKNESDLNFKNLNLALTPMDLQFLHWN